MNNAVFEKTMESMRKHWNIKLVTTERRRHYLMSKLNYYTTIFLTENLIAIEMKKIQILVTKSVYLGLPLLDLSETMTM